MQVDNIVNNARSKIANFMKLRTAPIYALVIPIKDGKEIIGAWSLVKELQQKGFDAFTMQMQGDMFAYVCCTQGELSALEIVLKEFKGVSVNGPVSSFEDKFLRRCLLRK